MPVKIKSFCSAELKGRTIAFFFSSILPSGCRCQLDLVITHVGLQRCILMTSKWKASNFFMKIKLSIFLHNYRFSRFPEKIGTSVLWRPKYELELTEHSKMNCQSTGQWIIFRAIHWFLPVISTERDHLLNFIACTDEMKWNHGASDSVQSGKVLSYGWKVLLISHWCEHRFDSREVELSMVVSFLVFYLFCPKEC